MHNLLLKRCNVAKKRCNILFLIVRKLFCRVAVKYTLHKAHIKIYCNLYNSIFLSVSNNMEIINHIYNVYSNCHLHDECYCRPSTLRYHCSLFILIISAAINCTNLLKNQLGLPRPDWIIVFSLGCKTKNTDLSYCNLSFDSVLSTLIYVEWFSRAFNLLNGRLFPALRGSRIVIRSFCRNCPTDNDCNVWNDNMFVYLWQWNDIFEYAQLAFLSLLKIMIIVLIIFVVSFFYFNVCYFSITLFTFPNHPKDWRTVLWETVVLWCGLEYRKFVIKLNYTILV